MLLAHRGGRAHGRDNALATFRTAVARGATGVETDVRLTADGVVVCAHDDVVGVPWLRRSIAAEPRERLPTWLPSLAELLAEEALAGLPVSVDVKAPAAAAATIALVAERAERARVWLCGSLADLTAWRELDPGLSLVLSTRRDDVRVDQLDPTVVDAVNLRWREWDRPLVDEVHGRGVSALGWGLRRSTRAVRQALSTGLDGVYADDVRAMVAGSRAGRLR